MPGDPATAAAGYTAGAAPATGLAAAAGVHAVATGFSVATSRPAAAGSDAVGRGPAPLGRAVTYLTMRELVAVRQLFVSLASATAPP